ncbi:helix-turn-helix domain-containing protein [Novosphingobium colocasiae]
MARDRNALIKSGARVLDILELFDESTSSVTVMEVARALDLPQSSTSGLLDCLLQRGYLQREAPTRAFVPTARLALLGDWVQPARFRSGGPSTPWSTGSATT